MSNIVIFGAGKIADEAYYYFTNDSEHEVVAFTVDREFVPGTETFGLPVIPFDNMLHTYPPDRYKMFVAVGYQNMNKLRAGKYEACKAKGYELVSYVCSQAANFGNVEIGDNCLVLENAVIQPCSQIGSNVFLWSGNHVGHHATVKDHCYLSGQVIIGGNTVIEPYCFLGINSTIGHEITVGQESLIGAGAVITKDVAPKSVHIADNTPRLRLPSDKFLKMTIME